MNDVIKEYRLRTPSKRMLYAGTVPMVAFFLVVIGAWIANGAQFPLLMLVILGLPAVMSARVFIRNRNEMLALARDGRLVLSATGLKRSGPGFQDELDWKDVSSVREKSARNGELALIEITRARGRPMLLAGYEDMPGIAAQIRANVSITAGPVGQRSMIAGIRIFGYIQYPAIAALVVIGYFFGIDSQPFHIAFGLFWAMLGFFFLYVRPLSSLRPDKLKLEKRVGWMLLILGTLDTLIHVAQLFSNTPP